MRNHEQMNAIWEQGIYACKCGSYNIKVVDSREYPDGSIRRTRLCKDCGNRVFTKEVLRDDEHDKELKIASHLKEIMKLLKKD